MKIDVKRGDVHQIDFDIGEYPVRAVGSYRMIGEKYATSNLFLRSYSFLRGLSENYPEVLGQVIGNMSDAINVFCAHASLKDGWKYTISEDETGEVTDIMKDIDGSLVIDCCNPNRETLPSSGPLTLYPEAFIIWKGTRNFSIPYGYFILNREGFVSREEYESMISLLSQGFSETEAEWENVTRELDRL